MSVACAETRSLASGPAVARRVGWLLPLSALAVLTLVVVGYAVLPTRSWLAQRSEIAQLEQELTELEAANATLAQQARALDTPVEIERIARSELGLVMPGEEAYAVLPPAPEPVRIPLAWPFSALGTALLD